LRQDRLRLMTGLILGVHLLLLLLLLLELLLLLLLKLLLLLLLMLLLSHGGLKNSQLSQERWRGWTLLMSPSLSLSLGCCGRLLLLVVLLLMLLLELSQR
jgi:hypothetical protein